VIFSTPEWIDDDLLSYASARLKHHQPPDYFIIIRELHHMQNLDCVHSSKQVFYAIADDSPRDLRPCYHHAYCRWWNHGSLSAVFPAREIVEMRLDSTAVPCDSNTQIWVYLEATDRRALPRQHIRHMLAMCLIPTSALSLRPDRQPLAHRLRLITTFAMRMDVFNLQVCPSDLASSETLYFESARV
jgi:hypothetical protein